MNHRRFVLVGLRHYWRHHAMVVAGVAVAAAVIVGALVVGDSVRFSLRQISLVRIGDVDVVMADPDRFFRIELGGELVDELHCAGACVVRTRGLCARADGTERRNDVQVLGVDAAFWALGRATDLTPQIRNGAAVNRQLADELGVQVGDEVVLTVERPSALSREAPLAGTTDAALTFRRSIVAIVDHDRFGRFSLRAQHLPPRNVYLPLEWLQQQLGKSDRANTLLLGRPAGSPVTVEEARTELKAHWSLADADLHFAPLGDGRAHELRSDRIFLSDPVVEAIDAEMPGSSQILTYFVNELRVGDRAVPYSLVSAASPTGAGPLAFLPGEMADDEIVINEWLADAQNLDATPGDTLTLRYYVMGSGRVIREESRDFRIRAVVPLTGPAADPSLMPSFSGLSDSEDCRDWDPGVPIDLERIRPADEAYWDDHRGTPKAFVTLAAGQDMWANRFGTLTAARVFAKDAEATRIRDRLRTRIDPASLGLSFRDVRRPALASATESMSFGGLFVAFSFFLIIAALLLTGLLFVLGVEQRGEQIGILMAVGIPPGDLRRLMLTEGALLAVAGGAIGAAGGLIYAKLVLLALTTIWRSASGVTSLSFHAEPMTVIIASGGAAIVSIASMFIALRVQSRHSVRQWLQSRGVAVIVLRSARGRTSMLVTLIASAGALIMVAMSDADAQGQTLTFFGAGALLLVAGLAASRFGLGRLAGAAASSDMTLRRLTLRSLARRRGRSLATIALLAGGTFMVVAVGAFRQSATHHADLRSAGTGGFALFAESTMPVLHDLNTPGGREAYGLAHDLLDSGDVVNLRMRAGDDASCLNLNRAQSPRLLAADPRALDIRQAFTFKHTEGGTDDAHPWLMLDVPSDPNVIPAVGDESTIVWGLGKTVGDTIGYTDEEGRLFDVRIVGVLADTMLQGSLLISHARFEARFPSVAGFNVLLIDAPLDRAGDVAARLTYAMADEGMTVVPAEKRLAAFQAVANTYITVFQLLGGLGVLLGTAGLGVVVMRNVIERRGELALLSAMGWSRRAVLRLIVGEHMWLVAMGLVVGFIPAIIVIVLAQASAGADRPYGSLAVTLVVMAGNGLLWTWLAARWALAGPLVRSLRDE